MNREEIIKITKATIEEIQEVQYGDEVFSQALVDLSFNSISFIKLIVRLETEFDIAFAEEIVLIKKDTTVNDIVDYICTNINKD